MLIDDLRFTNPDGATAPTEHGVVVVPGRLAPSRAGTLAAGFAEGRRRRAARGDSHWGLRP